MKQRALITFLASIIWGVCLSQDLDWARVDAGIKQVIPFKNVLDGSGNVVVIGRFNGLVTFNDKQGPISREGKGIVNGYIKKTDTNGNIIWLIDLADEGNRVFLKDIVVDSDDNLLVTGHFYDILRVQTINGFVTKNENVDGSSFILKITKDGSILWLRTYAQRSSQCTFNSIDIYNNGDILIGGFFKGIVEFKSSTFAHLDTSFNRYSGLVIKLNPNGEYLWSKTFKGTFSSLCIDVRVDIEGDIVIAGLFSGVCDFDPNKDVEYYLGGEGAEGWNRYFIVKLNQNGKFWWAYSLGDGLDINMGFPRLTTDNSGNIYLYGSFLGDMDFDPSDKEVILSANYFRDLFVQKTSRDGQLVWVKKIGGQTEMGVADIALGPEENIFICGSFNKVADFDPSNDSLMVVAKGGEDGFIEKLDRNGNIIWAIFLENTKRTHVSGIAVFKEIIYACGEISDETDFDPTENRNIVKALGERDAFTLKLSQCISNASLDENICVGDSLFFNQHFILKEGTFRDTFANLKGCDSLVVLQVCVVPHQKYYDTTTTCDSFLWLDNITYYSDTSLIYVAKTTNGCDSTIYLNLTIENCSFNVFIPNAFSPNSDGLNDRFKPVGERIESYEISIYTRWGELIYKSGDSNGWDGADAHSGLYMYDILLIGNDDKETIKRRESGVVHLLK